MGIRRPCTCGGRAARWRHRARCCWHCCFRIRLTRIARVTSSGSHGRRLEAAVLEAMRLMEFEASNFRSSDSEFDVVLECAEGRCVGEVEGRDRKAISIDKMRQLEVNIHEDLSREEVSEPAKGILFGNAFRLSSPSDRPAEHFTAKCMTAAKRNRTALIRTCDLFEVAKTLADTRDVGFATSCREAIFDTSGGVVVFPAIQAAGATIGKID